MIVVLYWWPRRRGYDKREIVATAMPNIRAELA